MIFLYRNPMKEQKKGVKLSGRGLPGHAVAREASKGNIVLIVPPHLAYPALAGRATCQSKVKSTTLWMHV